MENKLKRKILITVIIILSIVVSLSIFIFYLLYLQREIRLSEKSLPPINAKPSISLEELLKSVSVPAGINATSVISNEDLKNRLQKVTAPKSSNATVSEDILKSLTAPK